MTNKIFKISFWAIIFFALIIRLLPARGNNFYFTMDQGNDAVHVREILHRHQILLDGPETGIKDFYHGPFWYYFIGIGYALTGGHPFGSVLMLIILNVATTAFIILKVAKETSKATGLLVGVSLQFFWWFYDASRYGFNPFPLVALSILLIFALCDVAKGKPKSFILAAIPVGLAFHTESAGGVAFLVLYLIIGILAIFKRKLKPKIFLIGILLFSIFFIPKLISEIKSDFSQTKTLAREYQNPSGIFSQTQSINHRVTPQSDQVGIIILTIVFLLFLKTDKKTHFTKHYVYLTALLVIISFFWFSATSGWQTWHTVYIRPILFIAILLMLADIIKMGTPLKKLVGLCLLAIILISQILFFTNRWRQFARPSNDPSLLTNELAAVDWVYQKSQNQGFYVYSYLPSVYDYPYQYLFWWYGRKQYGYVPCEYSTYPNVPDFFVPGLANYQTPQRPCGNLRFLIIEPDQRKELQNSWLEQVTKGTTLIDETSFGDIKVQIRQL